MNKSLLLSAIIFGTVTGFIIGKKTVCKQRTVKSAIAQFRKAEHPVDPLFVNRWSPRAMSGEAVTQEELNSLLKQCAGRRHHTMNNRGALCMHLTILPSGIFFLIYLSPSIKSG